MRVLISNRGEIAARIIRTCQKLNVETVSVYTEADALSPHVVNATVSVYLGSDSRGYLKIDQLVEIGKEHGCDAVHPGYGFLSENVEFAMACEAAGIVFLGPCVDTMKIFSEKHTAKALARENDVPVLSGSGLLKSAEEAKQAAESVGLPVLLKATGGGGGMGIYLCNSLEQVEKQFETASKQGQAFFGNSGVFVEKYIEKACHVEVQIFGDGHGNVIHLGERECSIQRRHQKILEETPSPIVDEELREGLTAAAVRLCAAAKYRSAGTVEFLVDADTKKFFFLEVNTRLQVEHGITEMVNGGIDLVEWMLRVQLPDLPAGTFSPATELTSFQADPSGHAIEVRLCAENPSKDFTPSPGFLGLVSFPKEDGVRVDSWIETGTNVTAFYDSLLGKLMVKGESRKEALERLADVLNKTEVKGIPTNLDFLRELVISDKVVAGETTTRFLEDFEFSPHLIDVIDPGMLTTVQDYPGRVGLWHVGVPPSGPMDDLSFRLANALVGNDDKAAGLELTLKGPTLQFRCDSIIAITGAEMDAKVDGESIPTWTSVRIKAGQTLDIGHISGASGVRSYLGVWGGLDIPDYLDSKCTFPGGSFGGVQGRPLACGDTLPIWTAPSDAPCGLSIPSEWKPALSGGEKSWEVQVLPGPYADPDYFTPEDIADLYSSDYTVHYNSNRLGVRLQGPKPRWARRDGGEGGSHPSNVHDYVYAVGAVNFTGDMPIVLTCDGPSLGGFVCPVTILSTELWKMGQVRANDRIVWKKVTLEDAYVKRCTTNLMVELLRNVARGEKTEILATTELSAAAFEPPAMPETSALIRKIPASDAHPGAEYRLAGDRYVLVEYGPMELDINFRVRIHLLEEWLEGQKIHGLVEISPGVRSCLIEYDQVKLPLAEFMKVLDAAEHSLPDVHTVELPVRVLHLPAAFNEKWTHEAIEKYSRSVRPKAAYLPSNIEFMAKNNGLDGIEDVHKIVFDASYMVLGLGDVYLGACCAVPVDPRHRLVVPKYNPARTFTHEGTIGIGGSYMCIYPMNSPGGYQLVGRTLPIWNSFGRIEPFNAHKPWLLKIFDQVRFFEVSEDELETLRRDFSAGQYKIKIEEETFSMQQYNAMVESVSEETAAMRIKQRAAMAEQMKLDGEILQSLKEEQQSQNGHVVEAMEETFDDEKYHKVPAKVMGSIWEIHVEEGDIVEAGQTLVVLEAMKMEYGITSPSPGLVRSVQVSKSQLVNQGETLVVLEVQA